jgi:hypothetical protein
MASKKQQLFPIINIRERQLREVQMSAYNVVRFKVKPGQEKKFLDAQQMKDPDMLGFKGGGMIKTGDRNYCFVGHWEDFDAIAAARPKMISMLNKSREFLEDLGNGLGVTDPVSGSVVVEFPPSKK